MNKNNILKNIELLKTMVVDSNSAYALRVKIFRETIRLLQNISQFLNFEKPDRLEKIKEKNIKSNMKNICTLYNNLVEITSSISQPSEALGKKWNVKWEKFLNALQKIETFFKEQ